MITPDEALERVLALGIPVAIETVPLIAAAGRWAAAPIAAHRTQPAQDLSSMDGYAIRHSDLPGPWRVIGESAAGRPFPNIVGKGIAVRIFTGAALPTGADCVVIQENVQREGESLRLIDPSPVSERQHVRLAGSDFTTGQTIIEAGQFLTPARIGLAAIAGHATLPVRRRIRVALISTGDELVPPGVDAGDDGLPASNAVMLAALLANLPVDVTDLGIIPDDADALCNAFSTASDYDVMVSTGGASVGDHDLVQAALVKAGAKIDFWKIAMRPGKPIMAGRLGGAVALGLPGNPVSAFVTATLFLKPLIAHMSGAHRASPTQITARLASDMSAVGARTDYVRAAWQGDSIAPLDGDSGMLSPLAAATALIVRPAGSPRASTGDHVNIISLT